MIMLLTVFTRGLILSNIIMSTGLCFRMGFRIEKTIKAIIAEKAANVSNTSAIINVVISQVPIMDANCKTQSKSTHQ